MSNPRGALHAPVRPAPGAALQLPRRLQRQPRHRVAEPVAVALHQLLVEMLRGEPAVHLGVKCPRPGELAFVGPPRRRLAHAPVRQPRHPILAVAPLPAAERPLRHPEHLPRLRLRQTPRLYRSRTSSKRMIRISSRARARPIIAPNATPRGFLADRTLHALPKPDRSHATYKQGHDALTITLSCSMLRLSLWSPSGKASEWSRVCWRERSF